MRTPVTVSAPGSGLRAADIDLLLRELGPAVEEFDKRRIIMDPYSTDDLVGLILDGTAFLIGENGAAERKIVEYFEQGDMFDRRMLLNLEENISYIMPKHSCRAAFIRSEELFEYCREHTEETERVREYLLHGPERKALAHVRILQQKTLREKILLCFDYLSARYGADSFTLPMPFADLADYLCVDRSALMREIRKLNDDGIIRSHRRRIALISAGG